MILLIVLFFSIICIRPDWSMRSLTVMYLIIIFTVIAVFLALDQLIIFVQGL